MTAFHQPVPSKAVGPIEAADIAYAAQPMRDHAAAGLVKQFAMLVETIEVAGGTANVH